MRFDASWPCGSLALAALGIVASAAQAQPSPANGKASAAGPAVPPAAAAAAPAPQPAPQAPQGQASGTPADTKRLGRPFPPQLPPPAPRAEPQVHVGRVSPRDPGIHKKIGPGRPGSFGSEAGDAAPMQ